MIKSRASDKSDSVKVQDSSSSSSETGSESSESTSRWKQRLLVRTRKGKPDEAQPWSPFQALLGNINTRSNLDNCELVKKYGKLGAVVGEGSGGSIQLVTRPSDGIVFAVKRFRDRIPYEDERSYVRKIKVEFNVGSCLQHSNIIGTYDLFEVDRQWYEVMEYAPYCLFESVKYGKMSTEEIQCTFVQILSGMKHLHQLGYAHRDLKLENVVVTDKGIMKIIDFGSAKMCQHPITGDVILANGVVGCLPYMAPEILVGGSYDAQKADIWSLAILYCCMVLHRFPWKAAALYDEAFKLFTATKGSNMHAERGMGRRSTEPSSLQASNAAVVVSSDLIAENKDTISRTNVNSDGIAGTKDAECIVEPCWLLRQLPSESRTLFRKMLLLNAKSRPTMEQICDHPWIRQSLPCPQEDSEAIHYGPHHKHVLRQGSFITVNEV